MQWYYLELIHFNKKNTCKIVKTLSSAAQNETINLFLLDNKISMQVGAIL